MTTTTYDPQALAAAERALEVARRREAQARAALTNHFRTAALEYRLAVLKPAERPAPGGLARVEAVHAVMHERPDLAERYTVAR